MEVRLFPGSVLDAPVEAIVNAANTELRHGGGVAAAIAAAAGPDLDRESRQIGFCALGTAVRTTAGRLALRCVLHVPTLDYRAGGRRATASELRSGLVAALRLAQAEGCRSVGLPILGAGVAGIAVDEACRRIAEALQAAGPAPELVVVCAFSDAERQAAAAVFDPPRV